MKKYLGIFGVLIMVYTCQAIADTEPECNFEYWKSIFLEKDAARDALKNYYEQDYRFYAVADGVAASAYGKKIDLPSEQWCVEFTLETSILWVGADYVKCENHVQLHSTAKKYVTAYNMEMSKQLNTRGIPVSCPEKESVPNKVLKTLAPPAGTPQCGAL